jgi:hypothetical protein
MLCQAVPRVLRIFLTTPLSYAAVAFFCGHDEKLLRCGKLATSYKEKGLISVLRIETITQWDIPKLHDDSDEKQFSEEDEEVISKKAHHPLTDPIVGS